MSLQDESEENQLSIVDGDRLPGENEQNEESVLSEEPFEVDEEALSIPENSSSGEEGEGVPKKREAGEGYSAQFNVFKISFDEQTESESKLQLAVDFMEASLAQGGTPHFRSFWEARRLCLPLFKENIPPVLRSQLWTKYSELSKEARRLKEILDEQSAFAVEQIEIAIQALEKEISHFDAQVEKSTFLEQALFPRSLMKNENTYQILQKQLNVLNAQASRINALRKELLKTEMRVRHKNKFFQRLSTAGDNVFPRRKELIKEISDRFGDDVEQFVNQHFEGEGSKESLYVLREEIKTLQGLAKVLTLNTHAFTQTRTRLSQCWDKIKVEEKERKKQWAEQRVLFKQNAEQINEQISALKDSFEKSKDSVAEGQKKVEAIVAQMRKVELGRDELGILRDALNEVRKLIHEKIHSADTARLEQEKERSRQKKEKYQNLKNQIDQILQDDPSVDSDQLGTNRDALLAEIQASSLSKIEKQELERSIKPLRDIIADKKEKVLLDLSEDDREALLQMKTILKQRKERRLEIKNQLELLRKSAGSSSLDFEKAMGFKAQIQEEKERLEKANQSIEEIETKIQELQDTL